MADFKTHISVAAAISTPAAASLFLAGISDLHEVILYALMGTLGGLLPDIDADESISIRLVFRIFGLLTSGMVLVIFMDTLIHWQLLIAAAVSYFLVRYPIQWSFEKFTRHRGVLHSLLANVMFAVLTVPLMYHFFAFSAKTAWGMGGFIFLGATIHLVLDEIYSIELSKMRVKRSFGTALKMTDWSQPIASLLLVVGCIAGYWFSPEATAWSPVLTWFPEPISLLSWCQQQWQTVQQFVNL